MYCRNVLFLECNLRTSSFKCKMYKNAQCTRIELGPTCICLSMLGLKAIAFSLVRSLFAFHIHLTKIPIIDPSELVSSQQNLEIKHHQTILLGPSSRRNHGSRSVLVVFGFISGSYDILCGRILGCRTNSCF